MFSYHLKKEKEKEVAVRNFFWENDDGRRNTLYYRKAPFFDLRNHSTELLRRRNVIANDVDILSNFNEACEAFIMSKKFWDHI